VEAVASRCGFKDARQLRRLWRGTFGSNPTSWRERRGA
jgi:transcriptional regulator GlxA family with amidase domain